MPNFCPECGCRLESPQAKFCSACGAKLIKNLFEEGVNRPSTIEGKDVYDLGVRLEAIVEKIFQEEGFQTKRRQKIEGKSGAYNEIDIIVERGRQKIAVECKNYSTPVGIEKIRDFSSKLRDIGNCWHGLVVSYSDFTSDAETYAESENIELMGREELTERWVAVSIGRGNRKGEKIDLEYALPLNYDFYKATELDLYNKELVSIKDAKLVYHPFYKIKYQVKWKKRDPSKKLHVFDDKGTVYLDALDNKVLNMLSLTGSTDIVKSIVKAFSSEARLENSNAKKTMKELAEGTPTLYSLGIGEDYTVQVLPSKVNAKLAVSTSLQYIIKRHTHEVVYYLKSDDEYDLPRTMRCVPKGSDIRILEKELIHVPKWRIQFISKEKIYYREIFGNSGRTIKDSIINCPEHKSRILGLNKKAVAVCEICGSSLCEDHVKQCTICNKWICFEHSKQCSVCKNYYCEEHPMEYCENCDSLVCYGCTKTCPICNKQYCSTHTIKCENCGIEVCPSCSISRGIIRKTKLCKTCDENIKK